MGYNREETGLSNREFLHLHCWHTPTRKAAYIRAIQLRQVSHAYLYLHLFPLTNTEVKEQHGEEEDEKEGGGGDSGDGRRGERREQISYGGDGGVVEMVEEVVMVDLGW